MIAGARACPPVPCVNLHGKEGVSGSSPEEGLSTEETPSVALARRCDLTPDQWEAAIAAVVGQNTGRTDVAIGGGRK